MLLVLIGATSALANSHDLDFLNALRSGRLYRLAEIHAARLQSRDDLTARGRVELAIALAETHAQQALDLPAAERDAAWAKADETLDTFLTAERDNPRRLLVEIEQALLLVARSDLLRIEAEGTRHEQQGLETAREHLRQALRVLDDATQTVERQLAERSRSPASPRARRDRPQSRFPTRPRLSHPGALLSRPQRRPRQCVPAGGGTSAAACSWTR
jgi:hypothetical protein